MKTFEEFDLSFHQYWTKVIDETKKDGDAYEIIEKEGSDLDIQEDWLYFCGINNQRISCLLFRPRETENAPAICMFHGYGNNSGHLNAEILYFNIINNAKEYAKQGFIVLIMFARDQCAESQTKNKSLDNKFESLYFKDILSKDLNASYCRALFSDAAKSVRILCNLSGVNRNDVSIVGYSQGGDLALFAGAMLPNVSKIICGGLSLINTRKNILQCKEGEVSSWFQKNCYQYFKEYDTKYNTMELLIERLSFFDLLNFVSKIKSDILYVMGEKDEVCPSNEQKFLFDRITSKKRLLIWKGINHVPPNDFFLEVPRLLLNKRFPSK